MAPNPDLPDTSGSGDEQRERKMSLMGAAAAVVIPMLMQGFLVLVLSSIDPCNSNPGCMAGNITIYVTILVLPATLLLLLISTAIAWARGKMSAQRAIVTNCCFALLPFVFVFAPFFY